MRIGFNPNKDKVKAPEEYFHQLIIPVYIPNEEGYFKDSFQILQYCLESLFKTSHNKTFFTIVNNGSCNKVVTYLNELFENNTIHELIHTTNIGKLNAILKGINGHKFTLITISDADVLFLNNWQKETYAIYESFPKAGTVSPVPSPKVLKHFTANILVENLFSKKLKFTNVVNPKALINFAKSIGNENFYNKIHLEKNLTIKHNNIRAVVGAGHFVATYRGAVFKTMKQTHSKYNLGGNSETYFLDKPVLDVGLWRLSTENNYCYHLGNIKEPWMEDELSRIQNENNQLEEPNLHNKFYSKLSIKLKKILFKVIICKQPFWNLFLKLKGLDKIEVKKY